MADASSVPTDPPPPPRSAAGPLVAADVRWAAPVSGALTAVAAVLLVVTARTSRRVLTALAALLVFVQAASAIHLQVQAARWPRWAEARAQGRLAGVEGRARSLVERMQAQATSIAALPATRGAVAGD